jgi:endonuclease YncB( thermonuclease family)
MFVCFEQCLANPFITKKTPEEIEETEWSSLSIMSPEVKPFSYKGVTLKGIVTEVIDGDTVQVVVQHQDEFESHRVRLIGVKAPELHNEEEKELAIQSKESLKTKLAEDANYVIVQFDSDDRYGRRTGTLLTRKKESINQWMIDQGFAELEDIKLTINRSLTIRLNKLKEPENPSKVEEKLKRAVTVLPESPMYTPRELVVPEPEIESVEVVDSLEAGSKVTL